MEKIRLNPVLLSFLTPCNSIQLNYILLYFTCFSFSFLIREHVLYWNLHFTQNISNSLKRYLLASHQIDNYLVFKLKSYSEDTSLCLKEYNLTCYEFIEKCFSDTLDIIERKLGRDHSKWIYGNFNQKHFMHLPFSKAPGLKLLYHRIIKTDGNRRTPKVSTCLVHKDNLFSIASSNFKFLTNELRPENNTWVSLDTGVSGKLFHERYDDLMANHEKGDLIKFNPKEVDKNLILEIIPISKLKDKN